MATEYSGSASVPLSRRQLLARMGMAGIGSIIGTKALGNTPGNTTWTDSTAATPPALRLFATWGSSGGYHAGILMPQPGSITIGQTAALPTRAHGVLQLPDGDILINARRPGDWMMRWHAPAAATGTPRTTVIWADGDCTFNGHAANSLDGRHVYTTETDALTGAGCLGVRDSRSLKIVHRWATHGLDPHEILVRADGIWVANGGIATERSTGRKKLNLKNMDSSLVQLDADTGRLLSQWRVSDPQLSIRHLAGNSRGTIAASLQAQHSDTAQREAADILAICQPPAPSAASGRPRQPDNRYMQTISLHHHAPEPDSTVTADTVVTGNLKGYGGDIAAWQNGFAVSATRAGCIVLWQPGQAATRITLPKGCALASHRPYQSQSRNSCLWAGGKGEIALVQPQHKPSALAIADDIQLDNHWILLL